jgi:hypothetical protein
MSQNSIVISNGTGAAVRAALNNALDSVATDFSGPSEPTTTWALMNWKDTTNKILKIRNMDNSDWLNVLDLTTGKPCGYEGSFGATEWWRKSPDGFIEQGGKIGTGEADITITFPVAFTTVCYGVFITYNVNAGGNNVAYAAKVRSYSLTQAYVYINGVAFWEAKGY